MTLTVPCLFGLESLVADEMRRLDLKNVRAENGRVHCEGTLADIARLNINLRCGARVLMELGSFPARDFEALFQGVYALPWEDYIPRDGEFPVKGYSLNSQLHSVPACQSIVKKASAKRLGEKYGVETLPESGSRYQIQFSIIKDVATLYLDTSGESLYKRGYRAKNMGAPLRETLAAALVTLSRYRGKDPFCDPFCGSGTIPIGTGNDFLKNFGPDAAKFTDAENLWDGEVHPLDLIDCNGRQCLTIACSGIDARVAESVHELGDSPLLSGRGSYLAAVAVNFLFRGIGQHWRVTLDDEVVEDDFALVSMCNGRYYGGGSTPVPEARMDDGVLHTVLVKNISRVKFAGLFSAYSAGRYRSLPPEVIRVVTAKNVRIQSEDDIVTCLDGETIHSRDVRLTLSEKRLNFFGPKGCDPNYGAGPK